jgi:hypothetical protein
MLELSALLGRMNQTARIGILEAPSSPSTDVHCGYTQERSLHMIKAVPDSSNEGSILRTQVVVFGATKSNKPDGVEPPGN